MTVAPPDAPALAVSGFSLDLRTFTPWSNRSSLLAKLEFVAPGQSFTVLMTGRGAVLFATDDPLSPELKAAITAEAQRLVVLALNEAVSRGHNAKRVLWRIARPKKPARGVAA